MRDALNLNNIGALFTLLPYDNRINWLGKIFNVRPEPYIYFLDHEEMPFDTRNSTFSMANAWWLSEMAFLAYEDKKVVEMLLKNLGFEGKFFDSLFWDGEAFIAYDDEKIILSYRGTEPTNLRDWMTDIRLNKIKTSGDNTVHSGFKEHFDELEKDFRIGSVLSILLNGNRKVYITGHSLGGALAVYAAYYYMHHMPVIKPEELVLYTYGAPRIGDNRFAQLFDAVPAFRIVHKNDIVPRVPPFAQYLPVGDLYFINESGDVVLKETLPDMVHLEVLDGQAFDWKQLLTLKPAYWKKYATVLLDHSPVYYSIRLKEAAMLESQDDEMNTTSTGDEDIPELIRDEHLL